MSVPLSSSGIQLQPPAFEGSSGFTVESATLFGALNEARVHKTPQEVELLQYVSDVGSRAHIAMMQVRVCACVYTCVWRGRDARVSIGCCSM